ncbi:hypothetical protein D9613_000717 [Agrocybe pediades]|uniref:Conserved oligomeric Golgi complex subunit 2 n=1 Tax=Agrocybe pediades TaxID=84607 RepID=A0A8H4VSZ0_9AGAR|nr:hypothetical protein D9613_000717 [Agrocybe pediades]
MATSLLDTDSQSSSRDPYYLDRLADELANRESATGLPSISHPSDIDTTNLPDLPEYTPLSHNDKYLTAEVFNVEEFLLARSHTSLPDLRAELRQYHAELKEELVRLINDDYEAFISLSTDLRDEGDRLERLRAPLAGLKVNVLQSKNELQAIQMEIHDKLTQRTKLREQKALLHLLLKISESVTRLESLLLIASPEQNEDESLELNGAKYLAYSSHLEESSDEKFRANRAKHLGRVSTEYTQLLYHVQKARTEKCAFVEGIQWRIDRVRSTLSSDLDHLFSQTLQSLTDPKGENKGTELERNKWIADATECLRTYDMLGLWRDAEDVVRRDVVRYFVKKTIHPGALAAPHSPIVPNTPFHTSTNPMTSTAPTHQIPYTPFTAFIPKQAQFQSSKSVLGLPQVQLLDDTDDPLARVYNQILRFIDRDIVRIMDIAEKVTIKSASEPRHEVDVSSTGTNETHDISDSGFQFLANVVWDELGRSIMAELGSVVFAAGKPNEFRKHYETTQAFIRALESMAPSMSAIFAMRRHPTYIAFERRWQLPVYFQLRWKEIAGTLEEMFAAPRLEPIAPKDGSFATPQGAAAWIAISASWSSEIYIPELSHRFWKLTLQILRRYTAFLQDNLSSSDNAQPERAVSSSSGRGTPLGPALEPTPAEVTAADDALLRQYAAAVTDIKTMESNVNNLWHQVITVVMPDVSEDENLLMEDALREGVSSLTSLIPSLSNNITGILTKRCSEGLLPVRSIPSQFRAMSNKRIPTEPSYFISSILRPLKIFFGVGVSDGPGRLLKEDFMKVISTEVFNSVTQRYISYLSAMRKTEESLRRLKRPKKSPFSLFASSGNTSDEGKDEERIRAQMILDVEAFGKDGELLSVEVSKSQYFLSLKEIVYAVDAE